MRYVIIGNSAAAVGTIEGIRQVDGAGSITVISDEAYHTYSRPLISYLLCGKTTEEKMKYRPDDFYEKNGVTLLLGRHVCAIRPGEKTVLLEDGEKIAYDKLMVATGSRPFIPPMEGLEMVKKRFTFMTLKDAKTLEAALTPKSRVLIVGAGLIGLKCAEGIHGRVGSIAVVDLADRILPSILDAEGSSIVQRLLEAKGIVFYLSDSVRQFLPERALLQSGKEIEFDVVVIAVGVRPNTELVAQAGGKVSRGIATNDCGETSLPDIYAAGDCCESYDITTGQNRILALLPNAYMQGEAAGIAMAGGEAHFKKAVPMNAIGFFGLHMITAGSYDGDAEVLQDSEGNYKKLVTKDGLLKGYILIGNVERAGIYTSLIREQTPLAAIDYQLIKEKPQLMAFSRKQRAEKLGGMRI